MVVAERAGSALKKKITKIIEKLNQNYQKFILFNDNINNFRSHQLPRATREIFIKQKYGFLEAYKNMATLSQFRGRSLGELQFRV